MDNTETPLINDNASGRDRYAGFMELLNQNFNDQSRAAIMEAFDIAYRSLDGMKRYDGSPIFDHSIRTAGIVISDIGLGRNSTISTLLHDVARLGLINAEQIEEKFGEIPVSILNGLNLISRVQTKISASQADNFRDLIVSYSTDPRIILIKLADRLEVMRSLGMFPEAKQRKKSWESMNLYAQIAHKLGLYSIKSELEDISLKYLEPEDYAYINRRLEESSAERDKFIAEFVAPIRQRLDALGIKYHMKGRTKSVYSIWRKMKRTGVSFDEVYDIFAIRIIVDCPRENEKQLCWNVYSIVTDFYTPNPERMRDWISIPKSNGYESLHTTVVTKDGHWVEIQIRSERMDEVAERGIAAHWRYKGVHGGGSRNEEWLARLREIIEESTNRTQITNRIDTNSTSEEIFVFTPAGDLKKLPKGATVLDFAFEIHSQVGATCTGAKISGRNVPIKEKLHNGDIVNVLTSKTQKPKPDWLGYVTTTKARNKIKSFLREEEATASRFGREELERKLKNWKLAIPIDDAVIALTKYYKYKTGTELYGAIASGEIDIADTKDIITKYLAGDLFESKTRQDIPRSTNGKLTSNDTLVIDESIHGIEYKLAKCCNPIFGDDIFGFTTVSSGITIHRSDCPNAKRMREMYPYRVLEARWRNSTSQGNFLASLRIVAEDTTGIVNRITEVISGELKINIRSMSMSPMRDGRIGGTINIEVPNIAVIDMVAANLMKIKGIEKAYRVTGQHE